MHRNSQCGWGNVLPVNEAVIKNAAQSADVMETMKWVALLIPRKADPYMINTALAYMVTTKAMVPSIVFFDPGQCHRPYRLPTMDAAVSPNPRARIPETEANRFELQ